MSKEQLMRNSNSSVWAITKAAKTPPESSDNKRLCEMTWSALNSRTWNILVVILVFTEGLIVLSEVLIDVGVVRDPLWKRTINCTQNATVTFPESLGPRLRAVKAILSVSSIIILTLFAVEVILRIVTGKLKFLLHAVDVVDALVVMIAFGLDIAFFSSPSRDNGGREAAILIILLRLWKIKNIIQGIVDAAKMELTLALEIYHRQKQQIEHKSDLLVLKIEDLEHEVAYLKEKLKKTEKETLCMKKRKSRELPILLHEKTASVCMESKPKSPKNQEVAPHEILKETSSSSDTEEKLNEYAILAASEILTDAVHTVTNNGISCLSDDTTKPKVKTAIKLRRRPDGSMESGYGSGASGIKWDRVRVHIRSTEEPKICDDSITVINPSSSSPDNGYCSSTSTNKTPEGTLCNPNHVNIDLSNMVVNGAKDHNSIFIFPDTSLTIDSSAPSDVELNILDELSEIERIKKIEFDPEKQEDVPMTSL